MKTRIYISFNVGGVGEESWHTLSRILKDAECEGLSPDKSDIVCLGYFGQTLDADDARLSRLRMALEREEIKWLERREHVHTFKELQSAPLLSMGVLTAHRGDGGPKHGTQYDLSRACSSCGTGALQESPLILKASVPPKNASVFQTMCFEYLVSNGIAEALRVAGVTGLELRQAHAYESNSPIPWWQLIPLHELPPMAPETSGIIRGDPAPCLQCERDAYFSSAKIPEEIAYRASQLDVESLPDCVHTYECFGKSGIAEPFENSHFAHPLLLVKPKVFDVFREHKVRGAEFVPVRVIDAWNSSGDK